MSERLLQRCSIPNLSQDPSLSVGSDEVMNLEILSPGAY